MEKKSKKTDVILVIALLFILVVGTVAYEKLSEQYSAKTPVTKGTNNQTKKVSEEDTTEQVFVAPEFTVYDKDGNEVHLSDFAGKPVIINFWATWCGPCQSELPEFEKAYQKYGDEVEFLFIDLTDGLNETKEDAEDFVKENGYTFPLYFDTEQSALVAYSLSSIPMTVTVNPNGTIKDYQIGAINGEIIEAFIEGVK